MKMSPAYWFSLVQINLIFITLVFALRLVVKQRHKRTQKWPINIPLSTLNQSGFQLSVESDQKITLVLVLVLLWFEIG